MGLLKVDVVFITKYDHPQALFRLEVEQTKLRLFAQQKESVVRLVKVDSAIGVEFGWEVILSLDHGFKHLVVGVLVLRVYINNAYIWIVSFEQFNEPYPVNNYWFVNCKALQL